MQDWIAYLSGNLPGGIYLYLVIAVSTFFILYFMYRVNDLFTGKHFVGWLIVSLIILTAAYAGLWLKNPPHSVYKRYSVAIFRSNTPDNWLGESLTHAVSDLVRPYRSSREYFFPYYWLYRINPSDSIRNPTFVEHIYQTMPVQKVLAGKIDLQGDVFTARMELRTYPSGEVVQRFQDRFNLDRPDDFFDWLGSRFGNSIPFQKEITKSPLYTLSRKLVLARRRFFQRRYHESLQILKSIDHEIGNLSEYDRWIQFARLKLAGEEGWQAPAQNPHSEVKPQWVEDIERVRNRLLQFLQTGRQDERLNLMVAESYIWEQKFSSASIFLKEAYIENPFHIDVLLNLTFLHSSRYRELGFDDPDAIYRKILTFCPIEESVLLKWSEYVLQGNPSYTAPLEFAKNFVNRYLRINPYSYRVWTMLGRIYANEGARQRALQAFLRADSLYPKSGFINYNLGVLFYEWEKPDSAERYFKLAVTYDDYMNAHLYLGALYKDQGKYEKALREFRYRVAHKQGEDDFYAYQAMKGIQECLNALGREIP